MDENLTWKIIYIAAIFSLIVIGIVYFFISPSESPFFTEEKMEKIAEFKGTHVSGRKEGKKIWEFSAQEGWTTRDREITNLSQVVRGKIFRDGKLVVTDLFAPSAKAYQHSQIVEAFNPRAYLDLGKISNPESQDRREWTRMKADYYRYIPNEKRSEITGNVFLYKKDSTINAQKIMINNENKIADISDKIQLKRKDGTLRSDTLRYFSNEEKLEADGNVLINIAESGVKTRVKTSHASFFTDINKDMIIQGSVEVLQKTKLAIAQHGIYSQNKKELLLQGAVKAVFEKAKSLLKEESAQNLRSPEAKNILKEKTFLTADEIVLSTHSGDARAFGSVHVYQKGREAKSDSAIYNDKDETLALSGNVFMKKGKEWVSAKQVVVSVKDETFTAAGSVEAEFGL
ncbi:MAG: LptA/OstA family protein [Candidatus Margulisbacteria bacterium]|nr:LptA/OstA family protein [Candidatus Margulisiibacteriota bacterium]